MIRKKMTLIEGLISVCKTDVPSVIVTHTKKSPPPSLFFWMFQVDLQALCPQGWMVVIGIVMTEL